MIKIRLAALLVTTSTLVGCASTESLYTEYDGFCNMAPQVVEVDNQTHRWQPAIFFTEDSHRLSAAQRNHLDDNLALLTQYPSLKVSVRGFTDDTGRAAYNQALSGRRLQKVLDYLTQQGLAPSRIHQSASGKAAPLVDRQSRAASAINRRVEMLLLDAQSRPLATQLDMTASGDEAEFSPQPVE